MTTLVNTIIAEIIASWSDPSAITVPSVINLKDESRKHNGPENIGIRVTDSNEKPADLAGTKFLTNTPFRIVCDSNVEATRDIYIAEIKRIVRAKRISGGWWEITSKYNDDKKRGNASGIMNGKQVLLE